PPPASPSPPAPPPIRANGKGGPATSPMCPTDALGISAIPGPPVKIPAAEPGTGRVIPVHADRDQARWNPPRAVVFAGTTGGDCCHAADRTCGYINFFTSARAARSWAHANPTVTGTVLRRAEALRRGAAEFGAFMRAGDARAGPDQT